MRGEQEGVGDAAARDDDETVGCKQQRGAEQSVDHGTSFDMRPAQFFVACFTR
jgi:hypothetical protein